MFHCDTCGQPANPKKTIKLIIKRKKEKELEACPNCIKLIESGKLNQQNTIQTPIDLEEELTITEVHKPATHQFVLPTGKSDCPHYNKQVKFAGDKPYQICRTCGERFELAIKPDIGGIPDGVRLNADQARIAKLER